MGRMAAESGLVINYDEALASNLELAPGLEQDRLARRSGTAHARFFGKSTPCPVPGRTKVL